MAKGGDAADDAVVPGQLAAAVVDAPEAGPVEAELAKRGARLTHILNTHHHYDHIGSNEAFAAANPALEVFGGEYDSEHARIPHQTRALADGERFTWGGVGCTVRAVPGHTLGHITYLFDSGDAFVGDTLFVGGCGRLFEGTPEQMTESIYERIGALPDATRIWCAHEYTEANLRFARSVDGGNEAATLPDRF